MKKIILLSLAVLLIVGCSKTPEEQIVSLYEQGIEQIADFDYEKADSSFESIFAIDPASTTGLMGVAKLHEARLEYFDAIKNYIMLLSVNTNHEDAYLGLYNGYKNLGNYHEALEIAVHYNKNWHVNSHTKFILGEAYKNIGDLDRAEQYFTLAIKSGYEHKNAAHYMLATVLSLRGLKDDANKEASLATADQSDDLVFYDAAATYFEAVGLIDSAMGYNRKIFTNRSDLQYIFMAHQRTLRNNYDADSRMIIQLLENKNIPEIVTDGLKLFKALHKHNKSEIREYALKYLVASPNTFSAQVYDLYAGGEVSDKQIIFQTIMSVESSVEKGEYSDEFGDFYLHSLYMLSVKYNKNPQTRNIFKNILGLYKNRKDYKFAVALTNHIIGLPEDCAESLKNIEAGHQLQADWITGIADVWGNPGVRNYTFAEEYYTKAIAIQKNYAPAFDNYLKMLERIKEYDKALSLFEKFPQFVQNHYTALTKTKYLMYNKKYEEALNQFKKNYQFATGDIVFVKDIIGILKSKNRHDDIASILAVLDYTNPDMKLLIATNALENKNFEKSFATLEEVFAIEPENIDARVLKAETLFRSGKTTEALELFEKNFADFKNNPFNLKLFSKALSDNATSDNDYQRASNMARQAVFQGYGDILYLVNLADIYYAMGRFEFSRGELTKVLRRDKESPYPYFRYGMACLKCKDQSVWASVGKENLQIAIDLGLSGDYLLEANSTLK